MTTTGTTTGTDYEHGLVRQQSFECDGPVEIDIELHGGRVEVVFGDRPADAAAPVAGSGTAGTTDGTADEGVATPADVGPADDGPAGPDPVDLGAAAGTGTAEPDPTTEPAGTPASAAGADATSGSDATSDGGQRIMTVEVRYAPRAGQNWGLMGLLNWVGDQFGTSVPNPSVDAVRETEITVRGNRLSVKAPRSAPLRAVPLEVVVHAPAGSSLDARTGSAEVQVVGRGDRVSVTSGSGRIQVEHADGPAEAKTGSGAIRLGSLLNGLSARSGSGDIEVSSLAGDGSVHTGSGDIWLGTVDVDRLHIRTGSGNVAVDDAVAGTLNMTTGSGDMRVGIRAGVVAELDIRSGSGHARSDLPVSDAPPAEAETAVWVRARTGSGHAVISQATA